MIPLLDIVEHAAVVPVKVVFGKNLFSIGTRFENLGMTLRSQHFAEGSDGQNDLSPQPSSIDSVKGRLCPDSLFAPGELYSTERVFKESCADVFIEVFKDILR
jgi:hypothetical protein